jgi:hypothetical protein
VILPPVVDVSHDSSLLNADLAAAPHRTLSLRVGRERQLNPENVAPSRSIIRAARRESGMGSKGK